MAEKLIEQVSEQLNIPVSEWGPKKIEVVKRMLDDNMIENGEVVLGRFDGEPHIWIKGPSGNIVDPTYWTFTDDAPDIFIGPASPSHEEGLPKLSEPPKWDPSKTKYELPFYPETMDHVLAILKCDVHSVFNKEQIEYLGSIPRIYFGVYADEVEEIMEHEGFGDCIKR